MYKKLNAASATCITVLYNCTKMLHYIQLRISYNVEKYVEEKKEMAYDLRKVTIYGVVGLLLATSIIIVVQFMPLMPVAEAKSLLVIKVKDAPASLKELWLEIDGVRVHREGTGEETWTEVGLVATEPFDLMTLTEVATVLATEELPAGSYTEIRLHVAKAYATIDGEKDIPLRITTEWLMVKIHFTLKESGVTTIIVDLDVNETPIVHARILSPVVKATVEKIGASIPIQRHYRWTNNDFAETPTWKAIEDGPITGVAVTGAALRMRLSIKNEGEAIWSGVKSKLQYATSLEGAWYNVDAQGGTGIWRYHDGLGTDKATVASLFLTGSTVKEHFVESTPTETIANIPVGGQGEWDICINSNGAKAGETYYFRLVLSDGTPLSAYTKYPTLTTAGGQ